MNKSLKSIITIIIFLVFSSFLIMQADTDGYEGDDLNSVVPAMHLNEMRAGLIEGYKYDWQPLSYQLLHTVYELTGTPKYMFLISPVTVSLSVWVLYFIIRRKYKLSLPLFSCLLLMFPEVIYTGLYYNSHAPAMLCYLIAILALFDDKQRDNLQNHSIAIGLLVGLAILFRFDFILGLPIIVVLHYLKTSKLKCAVITSISAIGIILLAAVIDIFSFSNLIEIYQTSSQEIRDKSNLGGWDRYTKTMALTTILSPIGWLFFSVGAILFIQHMRKFTLSQTGLLLLALLALLYPLKELLSAKYALPFLIWLTIIGAYLIQYISKHLTKFKRLLFNASLIIPSFVILFVYMNVDNKSPYLLVSYESAARTIGTHDGNRTWGGYLHQFLALANTNHAAKGYQEATRLIDEIDAKDELEWLVLGKQLVFTDSSTGWRYLQLFLAEKEGVQSEVLGKNHIRMTIGSKIVHLCNDASCLQSDISSVNVISPQYPNF